MLVQLHFQKIFSSQYFSFLSFYLIYIFIIITIVCSFPTFSCFSLIFVFDSSSLVPLPPPLCASYFYSLSSLHRVC